MILLISSVIIFGTQLITINWIGIALVIVGFVVLNVVKVYELRNDTEPALTFNDSPALTMDMLESKDTTFAQPRDD